MKFATLYFLIPLTFINNYIWLTVLSAFLFIYYYNSLWLIPMAILLDGYFGDFSAVPFLSIGVIAGSLIIEFIKSLFLN